MQMILSGLYSTPGAAMHNTVFDVHEFQVILHVIHISDSALSQRLRDRAQVYSSTPPGGCQTQLHPSSSQGFFTDEEMSISKKLKLYVEDNWNKCDMVAILLFVVGVVCRQEKPKGTTAHCETLSG